MDNATLHKSPLTRQLIEQVGCELLYLPAHSPYLNPIEKMWGNLKQQWRYKVGSLDDLILKPNYLKD